MIPLICNSSCSSPWHRQSSIIYGPKASNAIPVHSPAEARNLVTSFLLRRPEENLLLELSWANLTKDIRHILKKASEKKLCNWEYDPEYGILKVKAMVSPLQTALNACIPRFLMKVSHTTLTLEEVMCIAASSLSVHLFRTPQINPGDKRGYKPSVWMKHPDDMIHFREFRGKEQFLQVVVEVGFSESYSDLVRDASQWLLRSGGQPGGQPKLVIIAKIEEDECERDNRQKTEQFQCTRDQLVAKYGDERSQAIYGIESTADGTQDSSPDLYEAVRSEVVTSDWVGPISVYIEVWELRDGKPALREPRIDVLPTPANPRNLVLKITYLIPEDRRTLFANFDASRTLTVDMDLFRDELDVARTLTAFNRAMEVIRPLDKDENDPEYLPWAIS